MRCTCPVCGGDAQYPERYAHKWHKCRAGCAPYPGTRLILVPGGVGVPEQQIEATWRRALRRGRRQRWAAAACGLALLTAPLLVGPLGFSWLAGLALGLLGAFVAGAASHAARTFWIPRPAGLGAEPVRSA